MVATHEITGDLPGSNPQGSYKYRCFWRNPDRLAVGCLAAWEVLGGMEPYQVALERKEGGWLHWTCTCPHAVYRAEPLGRACKHVLGLMASEQQIEDPRLTAS